MLADQEEGTEAVGPRTRRSPGTCTEPRPALSSCPGGPAVQQNTAQTPTPQGSAARTGSWAIPKRQAKPQAQDGQQEVSWALLPSPRHSQQPLLTAQPCLTSHAMAGHTQNPEQVALPTKGKKQHKREISLFSFPCSDPSKLTLHSSLVSNAESCKGKSQRCAKEAGTQGHAPVCQQQLQQKAAAQAADGWAGGLHS